MTSREQFEAAISASPFERSVVRWPSDPTKYSWPGAYKDLVVDLGWCMWQAARKQALEEAAAECERQSRDFYDPRSGPMDGAAACADAVRQIVHDEEPST